MGVFAVATRNVPQGSAGMDRVGVLDLSGSLVVALADGSGGMAGSAQAAEQVIASVQEAITRGIELNDPGAWCGVLAELDDRIAGSAHGGETTAVILHVDATGIAGASVGDSEAWLVLDDGLEDLTADQRRKPLLGSGVSVPAPFHARPWCGTLLVASDGLTKYAPVESLLQAARVADIEAAATRLVDQVRLRSGEMQDDVSLLLIRRTTS